MRDGTACGKTLNQTTTDVVESARPLARGRERGLLDPLPNQTVPNTLASNLT